jgi:methylated-DNA-protein-cysteine methyltransferase-like protein
LDLKGRDAKLCESTARIVKLIKSIPKGKVSSYGRVALAAGLPNGARQVVRVLHSLSRKLDIPWHRVIRHNGSIALEEHYGKEEQIALLLSEGIEVSPAGWVDMKKYCVY